MPKRDALAVDEFVGPSPAGRIDPVFGSTIIVAPGTGQDGQVVQGIQFTANRAMNAGQGDCIGQVATRPDIITAQGTEVPGHGQGTGELVTGDLGLGDALPVRFE